MAVSALSAARTLCEMRDWTVSNLEIQKILYLAHMFHLGKTRGQPLVREDFEAWDYGPVLPEVYHRAKPFGSDRVRNVFHWVSALDAVSPEYATLKEASDATKGLSAGRLVAITHWDHGAWANAYRPGLRGAKITNAAILDEYDRRTTEFRS
ncbi:DUF4065 domain-containing protein [Xanthobacteraceae bacterium Astr-EGSB]|uniref:Panacea domain-containing protein n=1 Tax=Astrobacterium formosum TaxID=3069710 RepID=UPI0027AEC64A|nr:DUF4065 domain-containing protein [Xanthobacteraceae bacterium Astr-EGSB]